MQHTEVALATKILNIYDGGAGAYSGSERENKSIRDGQKNIYYPEPVLILLHFARTFVGEVICCIDVAIAMGRYRPVGLYTYNGPCKNRETSVKCDKKQQIRSSE